MNNNTQKSREKLKQIRKKIKNIIVNNSLPLLRFVSEIDPVFDFHKAAGKTYGISLTKQEKADIIVKSFSDKKLLELVQLLISIYNENGIYSGKKYEIKGMNGLLHTLMSEEKNYTDAIVLLKTDISGSSGLTIQYPKKMKLIVMDIKSAIEKICSARHGKLLNWYGDGGFFLFDNEGGFNVLCRQATLCGINIMHWLLDYNIFQKRINEIVKLKVIIDTSFRTDLNESSMISSKIYNKINDLEKNYTKPGTILLSNTIFSQLSNKIRSFFSSKYIADYKYRTKYFEYSVEVEYQKQ